MESINTKQKSTKLQRLHSIYYKISVHLIQGSHLMERKKFCLWSILGRSTIPCDIKFMQTEHSYPVVHERWHLCMHVGILCMHVGMVSSMNAIDMLGKLCMLNLTQITHVWAGIVAHSKRRTRFTLWRPRLLGTKLTQRILLGEI